MTLNNTRVSLFAVMLGAIATGIVLGWVVFHGYSDDRHEIQSNASEVNTNSVYENWNVAVDELSDVGNNQINIAPKENLSDDEQNSLLYIREEEKLARDVYSALYEKWGMQIFNNIAQSEQTHTTAVKGLIEKYGLNDPVVDEAFGVFQNQDLQNLYHQLVLEGNKSLVDAFKVGATVEDLDIKDLEESLLKIDNQDIILVYNNLIKGSENHLRAFTKQLAVNGVTYTSQYISAERYRAIIDGTMSGNGGRNGGGGHGTMSRR